MREEHIMDALSLLDTDIIEEADVVRNNFKRTSRHSWKWAAAAIAIAAICLVLVMHIGKQPALQESTSTVNGEETLPILTIAENTDGDMGFEGYMAYDISDLVNNNPWSEAAQLDTLPVYKNQLSVSKDFFIVGADLEKMRKLLDETARRLGLHTDTLQVTDDVPDEETRQRITEKLEGDVPDGYFAPTKLIAKVDGMELTVLQEMSAIVSFEPVARTLPKQYNFTDFASYKEIMAVAKYLQNEYADFIQMENPQINIYDGDYNIDKRQNYQIGFFDAGKDTVEGIINYNFRQVTFSCDDEGKLSQISLNQPDLSEKTGDYPIITPEEAKAFLMKRNYITTVPYEFPGEDYIAKTELVYRTGAREQYFMPYYRFYVELPEEERDGMKTYGVYYVPAVEEKYISNMPLWDGSFN